MQFLTVGEVEAIHGLLFEKTGGSDGLRNAGLLDSAVAQPGQMFAGEYLHNGVFQMAAGYLFHLVRNHPFVDGNKRTGLLSALVFLDLNGVPVDVETDALYWLTRSVVAGIADKRFAARVFEGLLKL